MGWVASTLHTTSEHGVSSITIITTGDAHISSASSRLNWRPRRFKWACPFRRKTKSGFCACAITFQTQSTISFPWIKRPRLGGDHQPHLTSRLQKEYSYTSTPIWALVACSSSSIFHGIGPLVDPFRSHTFRSLFNGLPWFLLPVGEYCFITLGKLLLVK